VARSHESLWLAASAAFTAVAVALLGVNATFDVGRPHYTFWTSGLMVIVYVTGVLAIVCFAPAPWSSVGRPVPPGGPSASGRTDASLIACVVLWPGCRREPSHPRNRLNNPLKGAVAAW
jgi:hypothetical protein